jgi:hypothetical protein
MELEHLLRIGLPISCLPPPVLEGRKGTPLIPENPDRQHPRFSRTDLNVGEALPGL